MLYVYVRGVMDVACFVCIVMGGAVGARVWEVWVFRHAYVVCLSHFFYLNIGVLYVGNTKMYIFYSEKSLFTLIYKLTCL